MSNSALSSRKLELQQKEKMLLSDMSEKGSRVKQVAIWALVAGVIGLIGYGIFRSVSPTSKKKKKKKNKEGKAAARQPQEDNKLVDTAIEYGAPIVGRWLLNQLGTKEKETHRTKR